MSQTKIIMTFAWMALASVVSTAGHAQQGPP
ncbi:MAG: hypothetical protein QOG25_3340, partial [Acetobacteraceae bacterium]|nr:hypothetical protein [Acetobacteraceae bacterium]